MAGSSPAGSSKIPAACTACRFCFPEKQAETERLEAPGLGVTKTQRLAVGADPVGTAQSFFSSCGAQAVALHSDGLFYCGTEPPPNRSFGVWSNDLFCQPPSRLETEGSLTIVFQIRANGKTHAQKSSRTSRRRPSIYPGSFPESVERLSVVKYVRTKQYVHNEFSPHIAILWNAAARLSESIMQDEKRNVRVLLLYSSATSRLGTTETQGRAKRDGVDISWGFLPQFPDEPRTHCRFCQRCSCTSHG